MITLDTAGDPPNARQRRRKRTKPQPENQAQQHVHHVERLAWPIAEGAQRMGIGRTSAYKLAGEGKLRLVKIAGRTLIPEEEIIRLIAGAGDEAAVWTPRLRPAGRPRRKPAATPKQPRPDQKADIEDFVDRLVEATETRAATTSAPPNPRGRSAKGRASAGGLVGG